MALYHPPDDLNKATFAGGTMGQAIAKHKHEKDEKDKMGHHLSEAGKHLAEARKEHAHESGQLTEKESGDPREVEEEPNETGSLMGMIQ